MATTFTLTEFEEAQLAAWVAKKKATYVGPSGGRYTFCFTPTTIGTCVRVKDCVDGDECDLTDYDSF